MKHTIENSFLTVIVDEMGAELTSVTKDNKEYIWQGNPAYWPRRTPVLFPIVGSLKNKEFIHQGKAYPMNQHGFARDMAFTLKARTKDSLLFSLSSNEETFEKYPFHFTLEIGYILKENHLTVTWMVKNTGNETMYFSIGAHPGFTCPLNPSDKQSDYFLDFHTEGNLTTSRIGEGGLVASYDHPVNLTHGLIPIHEHLFDNDALIIENNQCHRVSLLTPDKKPYVTVDFDAPIFGVWSSVGKCAPFVCIEPWYGRCDAADFNGELKERAYGNTLASGAGFTADYTMTFE